MESFHHLLNTSLEVYHPKISYLFEKFKSYLIKIYEKIKDSFINRIKIKEEKFSIINDILDYFKIYNRKYKTKINFTNIIQGDNEDNIKISKICDYLLDIFLDIYPEEFEEKIDNLEIEEYENLDDESEDNIYEEDKKDNGIENEDKVGDDLLVFDEFYEKKLKKIENRKPKKRNYIEAFGEDNDLKNI